MGGVRVADRPGGCRAESSTRKGGEPSRSAPSQSSESLDATAGTPPGPSPTPYPIAAPKLAHRLESADLGVDRRGPHAQRGRYRSLDYRFDDILTTLADSQTASTAGLRDSLEPLSAVSVTVRYAGWGADVPVTPPPSTEVIEAGHSEDVPEESELVDCQSSE